MITVDGLRRLAGEHERMAERWEHIGEFEIAAAYIAFAGVLRARAARLEQQLVPA